MKSSNIILGVILILFSLTAFGYMSWMDTGPGQEEQISVPKTSLGLNLVTSFISSNAVDFTYNIDSRFVNKITKKQLHAATSIVDIVPKKATEGIVSYKEVKVNLLEGNINTWEIGTTPQLNPAQLNLLQSTDYSQDIVVTAYFKRKYETTGVETGDFLTYYMTITPEKEAEYETGYDALIDYLKLNSLDKTTMVVQDQLKPGRISFTVNSQGTIENVKLTDSSGYPDIDDTMVDLITRIPGKWNPAENAEGEKVNQDLVFFFGTQGC